MLAGSPIKASLVVVVCVSRCIYRWWRPKKVLSATWLGGVDVGDPQGEVALYTPCCVLLYARGAGVHLPGK